jgi:hypothetical protein
LRGSSSFGLCGFGGVLSIRRNTWSSRCCCTSTF